MEKAKMIIQIKSSYSGPLSHNLEDGQKLFISHTHVTHAYVQKQADENAVARLYLSQGELHLAPMSRTENVFLQNRPFTEDTVLGNEYLLQIKESILLFEVAGEIVVIMMGLSLGYGGSSPLKTVKVAELTPPTPSRGGKASEDKGKMQSPSGRHPVEKAVEEHQEETRKTELEKLAERYKGNDDDILLSESSTTAGGMLKSVPRMEPSTGGKWKLVAIVACMMVALCAATWFVARKVPVAPPANTPSVAAGKTETVVPQDNGTVSKSANELVAEDAKASPSATPSVEATVKIEEVAKEQVATVAAGAGKVAEEVNSSPTDIPASQTTVKMEEAAPSANENVVASAVAEQKASESQTDQKIAEPKVKPEVVVSQVEQTKPAVTLDERLVLAKKELAELSKTVDAPLELLEDKRFGQDVEWMTASFDKLKVSLRKVQIRELEKQMEVRQRAKNLDVSKFSEEATAEFQKRFKEYTAGKNDWGIRNEDRRFSQELIQELQKGRVNPNVEVVDASHQEYSGPLLASILSRRIDMAGEIAHELLKLGADSDVCFSKEIKDLYARYAPLVLSSDALQVVLAEGGVDKMERFLLPLLSEQDFYGSIWGKQNLKQEILVAKLISLKHNLVERYRQGNTALHYAAKIGSVRLVALMLLEGADVNAVNDAGETPLHLALKYGHLQLEELLLKKGANPMLKTVKGENVEDFRKIGLFFQNIETKDYAAVRKALENGMSPDMFCSNDATILQMACKNNDVELVKLLLEFNVNIDLTGKGGYPLHLTPVSWAFREKSLDIVEMLLEKGANPNVCPPGYGGSYYLIDHLCDQSYYYYSNDKEKGRRWFKALLNAKKPPRLVNWSGPTINNAFRNAIDEEFVSLLLDKYESFPQGSDVVATALFYEYPDSIVERLIEKKADVNAPYTIPKYTNVQKYRNIIKSRAGQKTTALWLAVEQNRPKTVALLLKNGADVDWKDGNGKTVKDLPCSDEIRRMLQNPIGMVNAPVAEKIASNANQEREPDDSKSKNAKPAVTLEERLALVQKELRKLGKAIDVDNVSLQLLEDKRLGVDVEWTKSMFGKLMVSLRKVQARELEKQLKARRRAKNLDVSKFSKKATADFQKQFKEYTATRRDWGYSGSDIEFSREVVHNLQKGRINPNVEVEDATYPRYSGALLACILSGRIQNADEIARELLKQGADPDVCLSRREMLFEAKAGTVVLAEGGIDRMEGFLLPLLGKPDFFNTLQRFGNSDSESLVAKLICLKHDLKEKDSHGNTPLHVAAKIGAARLVALMLLEGVDVNATNNAGETPLHLALRYGHLQLEQLFKLSGVDYSLRTVKGESFEDCRKVGLFFRSIEKKDYPAVRKALENGMSPDMIGSNNTTILQMACKNNDKELVRILLEFNANVELTGEGNSVKHTPLALAFNVKNLEIFEMLLEKGADPNVNPPGFGGESLQLLPVLCERAYLSFGNDKETGLRWLKALLNAKKQPKLVVNQSRPVIVKALDQKMDNVFVTMLLDKYESFPKGSDVIARALFQGYKDSFVERFIEKGADVNAVFIIPNYTHTWKERNAMKQPRGGQKTMALWLAVEQNRPKTVALLLKNGADVDWKDESGKTVKDLPCSDEIRRMLQNPDTIGKDVE